jgi:Arc/MetJ-type ribon-helix-helix transcriptional regulator
MDITITLPESWKAFIDAEVAAGGHGSTSEYIELLLTEARLRQGRREVESLLDEAVQRGEPREWTQQTLEAIRQRVHDQLAQQPGKVP